MMDDFTERNLPMAAVIIGAVIIGSFILMRQVVAVERKKVELAVEKARNAPPPTALKPVKEAPLEEKPKSIVEVRRDIDRPDLLEAYEKEDNKAGLLQVFRMGASLPQRKVEGVEYVKSVIFRRQIGTERLLADVSLYNDSGVSVTPRFQIMLYSSKAKYLARDTVLYITEDLAPGEKKVETMSFNRDQAGVAYYEIRKLD